MFLINGALAPLRGVLWVAEQIHQRVMQEMNDEETVRRKLVTLRLRYDMEEIGEAEYAEEEQLLLRRLREIRLARLAELGGEDDDEGTDG